MSGVERGACQKEGGWQEGHMGQAGNHRGSEKKNRNKNDHKLEGSR